MQKPHHPDTPESWGAASRGYAENVAPLLMQSFMDEFADRLDAHSECETLEVAAGSGELTAALAGRVRSLLATDFSPEMIEVARERMEREGATNVSFEVMDGQNLALEDASFDRAGCSFGLMLFPDRARGFAELRRVLRPGGRAMVSGWAGPDKFEGFGLFMSGLKAAFPDMPAPPTPPPVFSLANLVDFKMEMEAVGFTGVETAYVSRDLEVSDFDTLWAMFTIGAPPVQMLFDRVGAEGKQRVHDALADIVEQRFGSGPIRVTNVATVGSGAAPGARATP